MTPAQNTHATARLGIPASRLFVLLFLSTEVMFFVALVSVYLILRLSSGALWPTLEEVHVHRWVGVVNTLVLLASSWTMTQTVSAIGKSMPRRAKSYLAATIALGLVFLAIKGSEYAVKIHYGLYPRQPELAVYSRADLEYLAAVHRQLQSQRKSFSEAGNAAPNSAAQVETLDRLKQGLVDWTGRVVMQSVNPFQQSLALQSVAFLIEPTRRNAPGVGAYLATETAAIAAERGELAEEKSRLEATIAGLLERVAAAAPSDSNANAEESQRLQAEVAAARDRLTEVNTRLGAIEDRIWLLGQAGPLEVDSSHADSAKIRGLNAALGTDLPYVVPNGNRWISGYWMLTGFHALHLLGGVVAMGILAARRLTLKRFTFARNVASYWHFVDGVWLVVFVLVYWW